MSTQRHLLRRYQPGRALDFDEQFWPVVLSVCVLAALSVGTIVTLLKAPWMWASLIGLPIIVGLAVLALSYVEQQFWRRSIQVALLLSLAAHLFILIVACRTEIFRAYAPVQTAVAQRPSPIPQLEISVTPTEEIWNQPNEIETPDSDVSNQRQSTSNGQPSENPSLANAAESDPSPNLNRRESSSEITPQIGQSLAQRSRRHETPSRKSRELAVASPAPRATSSPTCPTV